MKGDKNRCPTGKRKVHISSLCFPSKEEWHILLLSYPLAGLDVRARTFYPPEGDGSRKSEWRQIALQGKSLDWINHLHSRLCDVEYSFVMMTFYFQRCSQFEGISERNIRKNAVGRDSTGYSLDPEQELLSFDRYSQLFYLSMFSALENIGQILNVIYDLQIGKIVFDKSGQKKKPKGRRLSFDEVMEKSNKKEFSNLPNRIFALRDSDAFNSFVKIRNDITHNFLPGLPSGSVAHELYEKNSLETISFGNAHCISEEEIYATAFDMLNIFAEILLLISAES